MINLLSESAYVAQTNKIKTAITNKVNEIKNSLARIGTKLGATINWLDDVETALNDDLTAINTELVDKGSTQADDFSEVAEKISDIETGITPTGQIAITQNGIYNVTDYASAAVDVTIPTGVLFKTEIVTRTFTSATTATFNTNEGKTPFFFQLNRTQPLDENGYGMISLSACQKIRSRKQYEGKKKKKNGTTGQTVYAVAVSETPPNYNGYIGVTENSVSIHCIQNNNCYFAGTYELVCYYLVEEETKE